MRKILTFLGRLCISLIFIVSAVHKAWDWDATERGVINVLCDWQGYTHHIPALQSFLSGLLPWITTLLILGTVIELIGGLMILLGIRARFGAFLLIIFLIPTTVFFHQFWYLDGMRRDLQVIMFLKNIAIIGGLLYILSCGAKPKAHYPMGRIPLDE